jgi:hypothetical protein
MMYARSLGPYVWLAFAKSLRGQNRSSTLRMKSWFHNDCPVHAVVLGFLILPPTITIEQWLRFDQAVTKATWFTGPHKSCMHKYVIELVHRGQTIGP